MLSSFNFLLLTNQNRSNPGKLRISSSKESRRAREVGLVSSELEPLLKDETAAGLRSS